VRNLATEQGMLAPRFFLASVSPRGWRPIVVVVSRGQQIAGLLYCKERVVAGLGTRIAFADGSLGAMVAARPEETQFVISCGIRALLKHMIALRFLVPSDRLPFLMDAQTNGDVSSCRATPHAHLELPGSYAEFLVKLGPRTRRNFRYYRRKSELAGNEFTPVLDFSDFAAAARRLLPKAAYATSKSRQALDMHLGMIEAMPSRMLLGLRRRGGEWIGLAGGWYVGHRAFLITQLNDRTCDRESVSLVLRSYLIEGLINRRLQELVFWGNSSAPLSRYAVYPNIFMTSIDSRLLPWRLTRWAWARLTKLAPATHSRLLNLYVRDV
jgi:hypothetical protein